VLLPVIAWGAAGAIGSIAGTALMARGRQWLLFAQHLAYGLTVLVVTFLLRSMGGGALAVGHLVAVLTLSVASVPAIRRAGILSDRAATQLVGLTAFACALCVASWLCPPEWRRLAALPATLGSASVAILLLTPSERRGLMRLLSREGLSRAVRGTA
jgi:hypothetical protein